MNSTWFELPESRFGIEYRLTDAQDRPKRKRFLVRRIRKLVGQRRPQISQKGNKSPFEVMLGRLRQVTMKTIYPSGSAILYLREIFEPMDHEFHTVAKSHVDVSQLSQEQVDRLRIMILPRRREEILVEYLNYFGSIYQQPKGLADICRHFDGFKQRYSCMRTSGEKFDMLFGFTFAIKKYSTWLSECGDTKSKSKLVLALARHWRSLLEKNDAEELGLDDEFSFPALRYFLNSFKREVESTDTSCGEEQLKFVVHKEEILVSSDDLSVSTMTMSVNSRPSL